MKPTELPPAGPLHRWIVVGLLASIALVVLLGIGTVALDPDANVPWQIFGSDCLVVLCFGVLAATGAVLRRRRLVVAMKVSAVTTLAGATIAIVLIWSGDLYYPDDAERLAGAAATCLVLGVGLTHSGVLSLIRTHSRLLLAIKAATMVCLWGCAALFLTAFWLEDLLFASRMIFALVITAYLLALGTIVGTIVVPVAALSVANRRAVAAESIAARVRVRLECPKCGERQDLGTGNVRCANCSAGLLIKVEEPRCTCGYLLYRLSGDMCPECGRQIPVQDRWAAQEEVGTRRVAESTEEEPGVSA